MKKKKTKWGGKRANSGRKPLPEGKKKKVRYLSDEELSKLKPNV